RADGASGLNDALAPAVSRSIEAGVHARRGGAWLSAVAFRTRTRDELVVVQNAGGRSVYGNAGRTERQGLELSLDAALGGPWSVAVAATWLEAQVGDRQLPGTARRSAWAEFAWSGPAGVVASVEASATSRIAANDANDAWAPGHARVDLALSRSFRAGGVVWDGFIRVNNALDRRIVGSVIVNEGN